MLAGCQGCVSTVINSVAIATTWQYLRSIFNISDNFHPYVCTYLYFRIWEQLLWQWTSRRCLLQPGEDQCLSNWLQLRNDIRFVYHETDLSNNFAPCKQTLEERVCLVFASEPNRRVMNGEIFVVAMFIPDCSAFNSQGSWQQLISQTTYISQKLFF